MFLVVPFSTKLRNQIFGVWQSIFIFLFSTFRNSFLSRRHQMTIPCLSTPTSHESFPVMRYRLLLFVWKQGTFKKGPVISELVNKITVGISNVEGRCCQLILIIAISLIRFLCNLISGYFNRYFAS